MTEDKERRRVRDEREYGGQRRVGEGEEDRNGENAEASWMLLCYYDGES
jgi:hypothetical protein